MLTLFFLHLSAEMILDLLNKCMYMSFDLQLDFFMYKNVFEKLAYVFSSKKIILPAEKHMSNNL